VDEIESFELGVMSLKEVLQGARTGLGAACMYPQRLFNHSRLFALSSV